MQNPEWALKQAMNLAEENIKSSAEWITPEQVIDFVKKVCDYLNGDESN